MDSFFRYAFNALLDDVIPILITYTTHDITIELCNHCGLLVQINNFYGLDGREIMSNLLLSATILLHLFQI